MADWGDYKDNVLRSSPIDLSENAQDKYKRIKKLEANLEGWFKYYFPHYYTCEPERFHTEASKRIIGNPEWYEVRSWSRELAKTARTMMEVLYLVLTEKKSNTLLVSNSYDNAERLLRPYKEELESNRRIINDYGIQEKHGSWESGEFVTRKGASFRALGKGQSPRGTRNSAVRPNIILLDDIDTDEEIKNAERITESVEWIERALIPSRSVSKPTLILACGNVIAKYCCITEMAKKADYHHVVNIRDENGKSVWKKNSEEDIDRVLGQLNYNAVQGEFFNNPSILGDVFKEINYGKCPPLQYCNHVLIYADPATSNRDRTGGSDKAIGIIAKKKANFYLYKCWLDTMSNSKFIDALFEAYAICKEKKVDTVKVYIENNSLQNPFYEQVLLPLIRDKAKAKDISFPVTPDTRKKGDKYTRIEGTLEPLNRLGNLIFNIAEKDNKNMQRMEGQMLAVSPKQKKMDGPDMLEGGVWKIQHKIKQNIAPPRIWAKPTNNKRF